ncbi:MAG: beta-N-acetylhexosaminidase [Prevotella sp.]|nr:beta-N-acetylhexosaminidase [Prevotella sp.]
MKKSFFCLLMTACSLMASARQAADFNTVPLPRQCVAQKGKPFALSSAQSIVCNGDADMMRVAHFLSDYISQATGLSLPVTTGKASKNTIVLQTDKKMTAKEGYRITANEKLLKIEGLTANGLFYGVQTLRKALPIAEAAEVDIPAVVVTDEPRFPYRGMHLDVSRHFFGVDFVKRYLDMLALHHINTFHFHLTDDQGWRVEIKRYPRLTEVGAWRRRTVVGRNTGLYDYQRYGGFYTQDEIRDIVAYARDRFITVIPEIDMPGHMEAVLAAYPDLGCTGGPYEVEPNWGVFDDILCAGKEKTFELVEGVLDELIALFPSEYVHIGGDEAPRTRWKTCQLCQQRIASEGLRGDGKHSAEDRLQGYFMKRVEKFLNSRGRKAIGWDELLDCDVEKSTTIMSWRGIEGGLAASEMGHDVIMAPTSFFYFDYYQTPEDYWSKPLLIGGYVPLEKVYSFEPAPETLTEAAKKHIIGVQANLWTEYIYATEFVEFQVLPRMGALAEVQWVLPEQKDYDAFKTREQRLTRVYDMEGYKYCKIAWEKEK